MRSILSSTAANTGREEDFSNRLLKNGSTGSVVDHKTNRKSIWWSGEIHRNTSCVIHQIGFASALLTIIILPFLIEVSKLTITYFDHPCCKKYLFYSRTTPPVCHKNQSYKNYRGCNKRQKWLQNRSSRHPQASIHHLNRFIAVFLFRAATIAWTKFKWRFDKSSMRRSYRR